MEKRTRLAVRTILKRGTEKGRPFRSAPFVLATDLGLEAEAQLEFDHATGQAVRWSAELTSVDDVGWRGSWSQGFEVQYVEGVKEIATELELGVLT